MTCIAVHANIRSMAFDANIHANALNTSIDAFPVHADDVKLARMAFWLPLQWTISTPPLTIIKEVTLARLGL